MRVTIGGKRERDGDAEYFRLECGWLLIFCFRDYYRTYLTLRVGRRYWQLLPEFIHFGLLAKEAS